MPSSAEIIHVKIDASSSGNNTLVAAASGYKIRVVDYLLVAGGAVNAKFQSGASGTDLTGLMDFNASGQGARAVQANDEGLFETAAGELLNLNLSGAVQVGGHMSYRLIHKPA